MYSFDVRSRFYRQAIFGQGRCPARGSQEQNRAKNITADTIGSKAQSMLTKVANATAEAFRAPTMGYATLAA